MPRVKRRLKRKRTGWTDAHVTQLLTGHDFFGNAFGRGWGRGRLNVDAMRAAWEVLRGELLPMWIAEHPGTRPYAWWVFAAPERRRRIDGNGSHPFDNPERKAWLAEHGNPNDDPADHLRGAYRLTFGVPTVLCGLQDFDDRIEFEAEVEYLDRLGLLTEPERNTLPATLE